MRQQRTTPAKSGGPGDSVQAAAKKNGHAAPAALPPLALEQLLDALQAVQAGDFSVRLPGNQTGIVGKIADTLNDIVATN